MADIMACPMPRPMVLLTRNPMGNLSYGAYLATRHATSHGAYHGTNTPMVYPMDLHTSVFTMACATAHPMEYLSDNMSYTVSRGVPFPMGNHSYGYSHPTCHGVSHGAPNSVTHGLSHG